MHLHMFLHDEPQFRRCLCDDNTTKEDKKEIIRELLSWTTSNTNFTGKYLLFDEEDSSVFQEVTIS